MLVEARTLPSALGQSAEVFRLNAHDELTRDEDIHTQYLIELPISDIIVRKITVVLTVFINYRGTDLQHQKCSAIWRVAQGVSKYKKDL